MRGRDLSAPRSYSDGLLSGFVGIAAKLFPLALLLSLLVTSSFAATLPEKLGDLDNDGQITILDLMRLGDHLDNATLLPAALMPFADLNQDGFVNEQDFDLMIKTIMQENPVQTFPAARIREASPANGEELVSLARTVILRFDKPVDAATVTSNSFYLIANSQRLPGRLEVSSTRMFATFFPADPWPSSTEVRIVVEGG